MTHTHIHTYIHTYTHRNKDVHTASKCKRELEISIIAKTEANERLETTARTLADKIENVHVHRLKLVDDIEEHKVSMHVYIL